MLTEPVDAEGFNQGSTMHTGLCGEDHFPSALRCSLFIRQALFVEAFLGFFFEEKIVLSGLSVQHG